MIVINFKNYKSGKEALKLARLIEKFLPSSIVAVPVSDIRMIASHTGLKVYAQHVDWFEKLNTTGFVLPEDVREAGAIGTLLNHSEHQLREETIGKTIERCRDVGLDVLLCVDSIRRAKLYSRFKPEFIAYEDSELIGSGKSITEYRKSEVKRFVTMLRSSGVDLLCGAGINSTEDVRASKELGCDGVLIASALAKVSLGKAKKLLQEISKPE